MREVDRRAVYTVDKHRGEKNVFTFSFYLSCYTYFVKKYSKIYVKKKKNAGEAVVQTAAKA